MKNMLIAANWKMNTNASEARELAASVSNSIGTLSSIKSKILLCPPFTSLAAVGGALLDTTIFLGAQNCHYESRGPYTGEISADMLIHIGCKYVIIGHSERRTYFNELNDFINRKVKSALNAGLNVVLCVGETLEERKKEMTFEILEKQLEIGLTGISDELLQRLVIAYEPVWAIGTGIAATLEQIDEAHNWIRNYLGKNFGIIGNDMLILYGGSLNAENADEIFAIQNVNGGLIGGASLKVESFFAIVKASEKVNQYDI